MSTVTKLASANTVVTGGWTSPTDAYSDNAVYSTCAPAKNTSVTTDWGFPAFTTSDIPAGSVINSVTVEIQYKANTTSSTGALIGLQINNQGTLLGTETTFGMNLSDQTVTKQATSGISLADLRNANGVKGRVRGFRSSSNTAITWSVDYVKITVDFTPATSGGLVEAQAPQTGAMAGTARIAGGGSEASPHQTETASGAAAIGGAALETGPHQSEAGSGSVALAAAIGETGTRQTEAVVSAVRATSVAAEGQGAQTEAASGAVSTAGAVAETTVPHVEAGAAEAISAGSLDESRIPQTEEGTAATVAAGELTETGTPQLAEMAAFVVAGATLLERHAGQLEAIVAELGSQEDPTTTGALVEVQPAQTGNMVGVIRARGGAVECRRAQAEALTGSSCRRAVLAERQPAQTGALVAHVATAAVLDEEQAPQQCHGAAMSHAVSPIGIRVGIGI